METSQHSHPNQRGSQNPYIEEEETTQWPKEKSTKGKRRYILDRSGNHQQITPNQFVISGAGTAYPSGGPEFTPRILVGFGLLDLWFYIYVL
jgi:hypothetical protein